MFVWIALLSTCVLYNIKLLSVVLSVLDFHSGDRRGMNTQTSWGSDSPSKPNKWRHRRLVYFHPFFTNKLSQPHGALTLFRAN